MDDITSKIFYAFIPDARDPYIFFILGVFIGQGWVLVGTVGTLIYLFALNKNYLLHKILLSNWKLLLLLSFNQVFGFICSYYNFELTGTYLLLTLSMILFVFYYDYKIYKSMIIEYIDAHIDDLRNEYFSVVYSRKAED